MIPKSDLKLRAVDLRERGLTYSEILGRIPVAKSTLSLWFHDVGLAEHQKQRTAQKRIEGQRRGAAARRSQRIKLQERIWSEAEKEIGVLSDRELWLLGVALYWAEGSKEKEWRPGGGMKFSNSDPRMIRVFLKWIKIFTRVPSEKIRFEIYIHETRKNQIVDTIQFWSKEIGVSPESLRRVYFKKNKVSTKRKNANLLYNGQLRVNIPRSTHLMRKIEGWVRGIDTHCRVV